MVNRFGIVAARLQFGKPHPDRIGAVAQHLEPGSLLVRKNPVDRPESPVRRPGGRVGADREFEKLDAAASQLEQDLVEPQASRRGRILDEVGPYVHLEGVDHPGIGNLAGPDFREDALPDGSYQLYLQRANARSRLALVSGEHDLSLHVFAQTRRGDAVPGSLVDVAPGTPAGSRHENGIRGRRPAQTLPGRQADLLAGVVEVADHLAEQVAAAGLHLDAGARGSVGVPENAAEVAGSRQGEQVRLQNDLRRVGPGVELILDDARSLAGGPEGVPFADDACLEEADSRGFGVLVLYLQVLRSLVLLALRGAETRPFQPPARVTGAVGTAVDVAVEDRGVAADPDRRDAQLIEPEGRPEVGDHEAALRQGRGRQLLGEIGVVIPVEGVDGGADPLADDVEAAAALLDSRADVVPQAPDLDLGQARPLAAVEIPAALPLTGQLVVLLPGNRFLEPALIPDEMDDVAAVFRIEVLPFGLGSQPGVAGPLGVENDDAKGLDHAAVPAGSGVPGVLHPETENPLVFVGGVRSRHDRKLQLAGLFENQLLAGLGEHLELAKWISVAGICELQDDLVDEHRPPQVDLDPPVLEGIVRVRLPVGTGIAVEQGPLVDAA